MSGNALSIIVMAAATAVLVFVTGYYAWQTRQLTKQNAILLERDYIVGLVKHSIKPLDRLIAQLTKTYTRLEFDWKYISMETVKKLPFEVTQLALFQGKDGYYVPQLNLLTSEHLAGHFEPGKMEYYARLLGREKRLRRVIQRYNDEAIKLWSMLWKLGVKVIHLGLKDAVTRFVGAYNGETVPLGSAVPVAQLSDFGRCLPDYCLYLACSKLLMESETYAQVVNLHWSDPLMQAIWQFWRERQDDLLTKISDDKNVTELKANIRKKNKTLIRKLNTVKQELSRIENSYTRGHYIRPEEVE